jgi:hypothetical protein
METKKVPIESCAICDRIFKSRSGLWKHEKKCKDNSIDINDNQHIEVSNSDSIDNTQPEIMTMFQDMMRENQDLRELLIEQTKQSQEVTQDMHQKMIELASENKVVHNNNNTINNTNNRFNLNFFLNEQCKNAMNLSDFLNNIEVNLEDVSNVGRLGYADGISRIIINALKDLDVYERPIHCSDIKREIMYIKDNDIWEKDNDIKYHMKRAVKCISHKNVKKLIDWRDAHPGWLIYDSKEEAECLRITNESMGGYTDEENEKLYKKMFRKIAHETIIDKSCFTIQ